MDYDFALEDFPHDDKVAGIPGWLRGEEGRLLYKMAKVIPGPILEVGAFVGKSTAHIAWGIKDSGENKRFDCVELSPTAENYRCTREYPDDPKFDRIAFFHPPSDDRIRSERPRHVYDEMMKPLIESDGGIFGELKRNMRKAGHGVPIDFWEGDFRNHALSGDYNMIFCDCMHNAYEVKENAARIRALAAPGGVIACHDAPYQHLVDDLNVIFRTKTYFTMYALYVGILP